MARTMTDIDHPAGEQVNLNPEGLSWWEWTAAAGIEDFLSKSYAWDPLTSASATLIDEWRSGVDPTEWRTCFANGTPVTPPADFIRQQKEN